MQNLEKRCCFNPSERKNTVFKDALCLWDCGEACYFLLLIWYSLQDSHSPREYTKHLIEVAPWRVVQGGGTIIFAFLPPWYIYSLCAAKIHSELPLFFSLWLKAWFCKLISYLLTPSLLSAVVTAYKKSCRTKLHAGQKSDRAGLLHQIHYVFNRLPPVKLDL